MRVGWIDESDESRYSMMKRGGEYGRDERRGRARRKAMLGSDCTLLCNGDVLVRYTKRMMLLLAH